MMVTTVRLWEGSEGDLRASISLHENIPGRRTPRTLRRPWEHTFTMVPEVTQTEVFDALRSALLALSEWHRRFPPEEGSGAP
jgi:hypothetical protein